MTGNPDGILIRMSVELTEALFQNAAGWDVVKRARAYIEQGHVLSSYWAPPLLRGVVQSEGTSYRASMVIKGEIDIENLCTCRDARQWGKICAHGVAVGLHWLAEQKKGAASDAPQKLTKSAAPARKSSIVLSPDGEAAELHVIFPPNLEQALERG